MKLLSKSKRFYLVMSVRQEHVQLFMHQIFMHTRVPRIFYPKTISHDPEKVDTTQDLNLLDEIRDQFWRLS